MRHRISLSLPRFHAFNEACRGFSLKELRTMAKLLFYFCTAICLPAIFMENDESPETSTAFGKIHPGVFELVTCWNSDSTQPVVSEINLDAVAKNQNQFDTATVKKNGDWIECPGANGEGLRRFRTVSSDRNSYVIEYQSNAGGTLTNASLIEFLLDSRTIRSNDTTIKISVLRILAIETI